MAYDLVTGLGGGGGGGGRNPTINDIFPITRYYTGMGIYKGTSFYNTGGTAFYTQNPSWELFGGAYISTVIMTSYTTIVNITSGSGSFLWAFSGAPNGNDAFVDLRITIDGTTRVINAYCLNQNRVLFTPSINKGATTSNVWTDLYPQAFPAATNTPTANQTATNVVLPGFSSGTEYGVRFESSCHVEMVSTSGWRNVAPWNYSAAAIWLDQ